MNKGLREIEMEEPMLLYDRQPQVVADRNSSVEIPLTRDEKKMLVVFFLLYFIQGIPLGFFGVGCQLLLAETGVSFTDLAILSISLSPFSFNLFTAPFQDTFYDAKRGKRKTYIIPLQYSLCLLYLLMGWFEISLWIQEQRVIAITVVGFLCVLMAAQQDIAVVPDDGWVLTALSYNYVHLGSSCFSLGSVTGTIFASNLMINLTSEKFAQSVLGLDEKIMTLEQFCYLIAMVVFVVNVYVQFFTQEVQEDELQRIKRSCTPRLKLLKDLLENVKAIIANDNIKFLIFFLLTYRLPFGAVVHSSFAKLVRDGFPKEVLTYSQILFVPFGIFISVFVGAKMKIGRDMPWALRVFMFRFADTLFQFILVINFTLMGGLNIITGPLIFISFLSSMSLTQFNLVILGGFSNRISDLTVGATYVTLLNSASNLGLALSEAVTLSLIDKIGYIQTVLLGWALGIVYYSSLKNKLLALSLASKQSWNIVEKVKCDDS